MAIESFSTMYAPLPMGDSKESNLPLLGDEEAPQTDSFLPDKRLASVVRKYILLARPALWFAVMLMGGLILFLAGMSVGSTEARKDSELSCVDTPWDTLKNEAISFRTQVFDGHFEDKSEYQGAPNPSLTAKWDAISGLWEYGVTRAVLEKANKTRGLVQYPGTDRYMVGLEAFHDLHCLDYIRRYTYMEYYPSIIETLEERTSHKDHCIEMFRQKLTCTPDLNIYTYHWLSTSDLPYNDFKMQHRCVDWDRFAGWAKRQRVHHPAGMRKPEGADVYDPY